MTILTNSVRAAIGNSIATETVKDNYKEMMNLSFGYMWISGWFAVCIGHLIQPFMKIWVGDDLLLNNTCAVLFAIYFYVLRIGEIRSLYIEAVGLWKENRVRALVEMIVNIVFNWLLVQKYGITGILVATIISVLIISQGYGTKILYKFYFKDEFFKEFVVDNLKFFSITVLSYFILWLIFSLINIDNIVLELLIKGVGCVIVPNIIFLCTLKKDKRFVYVKEILSRILRR